MDDNVNAAPAAGGLRVAVVGATGNAGTAVLASLLAAPEVASVLGIARRMPDKNVAPYSGCEWASIDIAAATDESEAEYRLASAFAGVDAVIHLAWLIQPNSQRELLRRVNVEGTIRVARAVAAAGVPHLVVASSVGAYSPDAERRRRTETWPTDGVRSSHYSVDKAAQEGVLDDFSAAHPDVVVTRIRPALTFQPRAASEIQRYFLSRWIPVGALRRVKPPLLPLPDGFRGMQAIHADDLAQAYTAAVVRRAPGAFNICADDILDGRALARILDHGHVVTVPRRLARAALAIAHKAGLVAADEGWLDMALGVPMMDNAKAASELDWRPRRTADEALRSLLGGMMRGQGTGSVPLRPRDATPSSPRVRAPRAARDRDAARISRRRLGIYLSDHLTGAAGAADRIDEMTAAYADAPFFAPLSEIAADLRSERELLRRIIRDLGLRPRRDKQLLARIGERLGRLKGNGRVLSRSPVTPLLETEVLRGAVNAKIGLWRTLDANADELGLDRAVLGDLVDRAQRQSATLDEVHAFVSERAFRDDREVFSTA